SALFSAASVAVCAGMALFAAFRTASARSAMAFPHTYKTGARRGAGHSEDGKNTEPSVPRQPCHTQASRLGDLVPIRPDQPPGSASTAPKTVNKGPFLV